MTTRERRAETTERMAMPGHCSGLWGALVTAVQDGDEDEVTSRRRLAALQLRHAYATLADYGRRVG